MLGEGRIHAFWSRGEERRGFSAFAEDGVGESSRAWAEPTGSELRKRLRQAAALAQRRDVARQARCVVGFEEDSRQRGGAFRGLQALAGHLLPETLDRRLLAHADD